MKHLSFIGGWVVLAAVCLGLVGCQGVTAETFRLDDMSTLREQDGRVTSIGGLGRPGASIEIRDNDVMLGRTAVDEEGRWKLEYAFKPRKYHIVIVELDNTGKALRTYGQYYLKGHSNLAAPEPESAQGDPKEASAAEKAPAAEEPVPPAFAIKSPSSGDLVKAGRLKISGVAPARSEMVVYVNGRGVGRARSNRIGQWMLFAEVGTGPLKISIVPREKGARGSEVTLNAE